MPELVKAYVRWIDMLNRTVGRVVVYMIFVMVVLLLYSSFSRTFLVASPIWIVEMAQFLLAAYYLLGGGYSMQLDAHVRMDLFYGRWSVRRRAFTDSLTAFCLVFYLVVLLLGGISSTRYALQYGQRNYSAWAPPLAPIKIVMTIGVALMLLQAVSIFLKDLARLRGEPLP